MNKFLDIDCPIDFILVAESSGQQSINFTGLTWTRVRTVGEWLYKLTGIRIGRRVSREESYRDWRMRYYEIGGSRPVMWVIEGLRDLAREDLPGSIGVTQGEFALVAGENAAELVIAHEIGHLLGLSHDNSALMKPQGLENRGLRGVGITSGQRKIMRKNAWLWGVQ